MAMVAMGIDEAKAANRPGNGETPMCGRYSIAAMPEQLLAMFEVETGSNLEPRWNVAPTQEVPVVRAAAGGGREMTIMRWGLVPVWARDIRIGASLINARAETVADKPAFRAAFRRRRCLVPADGFYEWQAAAGGKRPWRVARRNRAAFAFAGLWELWEGTGEGSALESFTILTVEANEAIRAIHHRMPVMLFDAADFDLWLAGRPDAAAGLLRPCDAAAIEAWPVDKRVGNVRHDDPALAEPVAAPAAPPPAAQGSLF